MRAGQRVQLKQLSRLAEAFRLKDATCGTVLCSYSAERRPGAREFLDVRLDSQVTLWGVAASAFEDAQQSAARKA
jgi:hypothetical protein